MLARERAEAAAAKRAHQQARMAAYNEGRRAAGAAQAMALGLPSLAGWPGAAEPETPPAMAPARAPSPL